MSHAAILRHLSIVAIFLLPTQTSAASNDACGVVSAGRGYRLQIDRFDAAIIAARVLNACALLDEVGKGDDASRDMRQRVADGLRADVLAPLVRTYPDILGQVPAGDTKKRLRMGALTAMHLRWALARPFPMLEQIDKTACATRDKVKACLNIDAELAFAVNPVEKAYPDLRLLSAKEAAARNQAKRSATSDALFRKLAPPAGSVAITPAALAILRDFMKETRVTVAHPVPTIGWTVDSQSRSPNETEWHTLPPHVGIGVYDRSFIPPEVMRRYDGLDVVFDADPATRFAGKTIDYVGGHFVVRDK